jgi:hypothetical protein
MKKITLGFFILSFLTAMFTADARADVTNITGGIICGSSDCSPSGAIPVLQGKKTTLSVDGQDVNFADKNNVDVSGGGITARITKDYLISPKFGLGTGRVDVEFDIGAEAAPGERTVTLNHNGCLGCPKKYKFKILVVRDGKISSVNVPSPTEFFQQVDITFNGQHIGGAGVNLIGFPSGTTAQVIGSQSSETKAVVRLNFSSVRAEASGSVQLFDNACGNKCVIHNEAYDGLTNGLKTDVAIVGPNAVKEIVFPNGSSVTVGSVLTIQINLVRPVSSVSRGVTASAPGGSNRDGEVIFWQLVPSNVFEAAPGSGVSFSPTGLNQVRVPVGDTLVRLTVRLKQIPSGCSQSGCSADIQTRTGNINTDQPPFFKAARFTIVPPSQ